MMFHLNYVYYAMVGDLVLIFLKLNGNYLSGLSSVIKCYLTLPSRIVAWALIGHRLQTEGTYRFTLVRPSVR